MPAGVRRVAALYDVHGNLPALEAVLDEIEAAGVDAIVVGGDVVPGPMPGETLERLLALRPRAQFLRGNTDRATVDAFDGRQAAHLPAAAGEAIAWSAGRLEKRHRDFLAGLPPSLELVVEGLGDVLFCHATPRSDEEIFTVASPAVRVQPMLAGVTADLVVCGHTHMQFDRRVAGARVVNAGSVGMPFGAAGAHWLLLGPDVRLMRTAYDLERAAARIRATSYPQAEEFAARNVLERRTEEEALALFEPPPPPTRPHGAGGDDAPARAPA